MRKVSVLILMVMLNCSIAFPQVSINADGAAPDASAGLDVTYTNKGILIPRMTMGQRDAIATPAEGLMIFCTNCGLEGSLSTFSNGTWKTYSSCSCNAPTTNNNHGISPGQIIWNWNTVENVFGYKWNTVNDYNTAENMGLVTSKLETGTVCDTVYARYLWAYNGCSASSVTFLTQPISGAYPQTPGEGTHSPEEFQITWSWSAVSGAIGYKFNTVNDYNSAVNLGLSTTFEETPLFCGTPYTRYVWAYNDCAISAATTLDSATSACFVCGDTLTISHTTDTVAPVNKTTSYYTVDSIPGALTKCWITSNLGSDHQATAVNDATEASAGWYWQFNRAQGYMDNGAGRIPLSAWSTAMNDENFDWVALSDPCFLELGAGWRLPTSSEWSALDNAGDWTNWNGPWNSNLKLHAAGKLSSTDGSLSLRGIHGLYWSSDQFLSYNYGFALFLYSSSCSVSQSQFKSYGFTVRCLKD